MSNYLNGVWVIRKEDYWSKDKHIVLDKTSKFIELNNENGRISTICLNYAAITDEDFKTLVKIKAKKEDEIAVWFEIEKALVDRVGIKWRGRYGQNWVHNTNVWMLAGYTKLEKEKLIDEMMRAFKEAYGDYPKTVATWLIDAYSVNYMTNKYDIDAVIICREQWGMDGISPWGGPYYGAYYPCKNNIICPAQTQEQQINTPVFRMFVNDPIYCYYEHTNEDFNGLPSGAFTQELVYVKTGQNPIWLKWIWNCLFGEKSDGFSYFQTGQENAFGFENISKGYTIHNEFLKEVEYESISVGEMGRRFKEKYKKTPSRFVAAMDDWAEFGNQSIWFNNSIYRINVFSDNNNVWIRDIHIFDENYEERYVSEPLGEHGALYDNLPVTDGVRFQVEPSEKPGIYFGNGYIKDCEKKDGNHYIKVFAEDKTFTLKLGEKMIEISTDEDFELSFKCNYRNFKTYILNISKKEIEYVLRRKTYSIVLEDGIIDIDDNIVMKSENGKITIVLSE